MLKPALLAFDTAGRNSFDVKKPCDRLSPSKGGISFGWGRPVKRNKVVNVQRHQHDGFMLS